jgi:hypothetical protein
VDGSLHCNEIQIRLVVVVVVDAAASAYVADVGAAVGWMDDSLRILASRLLLRPEHGCGKNSG